MDSEKITTDGRIVEDEDLPRHRPDWYSQFAQSASNVTIEYPEIPQIDGNEPEGDDLPRNRLDIDSQPARSPSGVAAVEGTTSPDGGAGSRQGSSGIQVSGADTHRPMSGTVIPLDIVPVNGVRLVYSLPQDTFINATGTIQLTAVTEDGSALPKWITFDRLTGRFVIDVPEKLQKTLEVRITAVDSSGNTAQKILRVHPGSDRATFVGKRPFTMQLRSISESRP